MGLELVNSANVSKARGLCLKASPYGVLTGGDWRVLLDPGQSNMWVFRVHFSCTILTCTYKSHLHQDSSGFWWIRAGQAGQFQENAGSSDPCSHSSPLTLRLLPWFTSFVGVRGSCEISYLAQCWALCSLLFSECCPDVGLCVKWPLCGSWGKVILMKTGDALVCEHHAKSLGLRRYAHLGE